MWWVLGVILTFVAAHYRTRVPGVTVVVWVGSTIFVASCCLATVPGIATVIVTPPWMEFVVALPGVVVDLSLLPKSLDLSWSSGIGEGGRHGEVIRVLLGVVGGGTDDWDDEMVAYLGGFLYDGPPCIQCPYLGHSVSCIVHRF